MIKNCNVLRGIEFMKINTHSSPNTMPKRLPMASPIGMEAPSRPRIFAEAISDRNTGMMTSEKL